jgi:hypothetical protein
LGLLSPAICLLQPLKYTFNNDAAGEKGIFRISANIIIEFIGFSTFASVRPHKKAACLPARQGKKNEAEGAKEKQLLPKLGNAIGL